MRNFIDSATVSGVKITQEGYLIADAFTARTGIQLYAGHEVGVLDKTVVKVYRPEEEVFKRDSVQAFSHIPVTNDHPSVPVTKDNWKELAVGEVSTEVMRDGQRLKIPLIVKDQAAIAAIQGGKRELSVGYACDVVMEAGITPEGVAYDAVQRNIRPNHVAIVQRGRAGPEFRIGDGAHHWGATPLTVDEETQMNTRTIMVDGLSVVTTDQGAQAIEKLQNQLRDSTSNLEKLVADHNAAIIAKDTELGEVKAKLADAEKQIPDAAAIEKMVSDRVSLLADAQRVAKDAKFDGLSDADVRKAAVGAFYGDEMVKDASDAEVAGMFKAALASVTKDSAPAVRVNTDPVKTALQNRTTNDSLLSSQQQYERRLSDAWKGETATQ